MKLMIWTALSPISLSIHNDFIGVTNTGIKTFKYADDMAIVSLLNFKVSPLLIVDWLQASSFSDN